MGVVLFVGTSLPVQARTYVNGDTSGSITVTGNVTSSYSITLPAILELTLQDDGSWANDYTVGVKANITGAESVIVTPAIAISALSFFIVCFHGESKVRQPSHLCPCFRAHLKYITMEIAHFFLEQF